MFFDVLAVLVLTFFASLGMVTLSGWLMKLGQGKRLSHKIFVVARADSVPLSDLENGVRLLLAETELSGRLLLLNGENTPPEALSLGRNLERRFNCLFFQNKKDLLSYIISDLQEEEKQV